jgi:PEGA domain-containing protein
MKNILVKILMFLLIASIISAEDSLLYIETNKDNSNIYLNDDFIGNGNIIVKLEPGSYIITVREDAIKWNSQVFIDSIFIKPDEKNKKLTYDFNEQIYLDSSPQDSRVYSGDSLLGNTPLLLDKSFTELSLKKRKYKNKIFSLNETQKGKPIELDFTGEEKNGTFVGSNLFWTLVGSAVALGSTAVYYKIKADKNYDKYLEFGDKAYLDKTDRQDLISGISFGTLQLNLGALIYFVLTE